MKTLSGLRRAAEPVEADLADRRLDVARRNTRWTEIDPPERLRPRGMGLLVDSETELVWVRRRGVVWAPGTATVEYVDPGSPQTFYVSSAGEVVFLERASGIPGTWSEHVARQVGR